MSGRELPALRDVAHPLCLALLLVGAGCNAFTGTPSPSASPTDAMLEGDCERVTPLAVQQAQNASTESEEWTPTDTPGPSPTPSPHVEWVRNPVEMGTYSAGAVVRAHGSGTVVTGARTEAAKFSPTGDLVWEARVPWQDWVGGPTGPSARTWCSRPTAATWASGGRRPPPGTGSPTPGW